MITENDKKLGKRIQKLRNEVNLTQDELSEKVRISSKYLQFIENGRRVPSLKTVYRIAHALDKKVSELFPF